MLNCIGSALPPALLQRVNTSTSPFKYTADRLPVTVICALTAVDAVMYFSVESVWLLCGYWLLTIVPKGTIGAWNHHHQHTMTFRSAALNRAYEVVLALHTGVTSNLWVLHHVLGHHLNYLDQTRDESRWRRRNGERMGVIEYTCSVAFTAYGRGYHVGKRYPAHQRVFLVWTAVVAVIVLGLTWYKPLQGLFLLLLPMTTSLLFTAWVTFDHHAGLDADDPFHASYNIIHPLFNRLTGNLGYHTAHHYKQALHWSKLPELHAEIAPSIPRELFRQSTFFKGAHVPPPPGDAEPA